MPRDHATKRGYGADYGSGKAPRRDISPAGLIVSTPDQVNKYGVLNLVLSSNQDESSKGISQVAYLLSGGPNSGVKPEDAEGFREKHKFRELGREIALTFILARFPKTSYDTANAWVDGGSELEWYDRVSQNLAIIKRLTEEYDPRAVQDLATIFGIRNFHRFSFEHWVRQHKEKDYVLKQHVPFFMGILDDRNSHIGTARAIEQMESMHGENFAFRAYEWKTEEQIKAQLSESTKSYGPTMRNLYLIAHGTRLGLTSTLDFHGRIDLNFNIHNIGDSLRAATNPFSNIVVVSCDSAVEHDENVALKIGGKESFAERLAAYSQRGVIATEEPISLKRLEFEDGDRSKGIVPVFYSSSRRQETRGKKFAPGEIKEDWK